MNAGRISFKGSVQALRQWEPHLNQSKSSRQERGRLIRLLYKSIAGNIVPERPGRSEPRVKQKFITEMLEALIKQQQSASG